MSLGVESSEAPVASGSPRTETATLRALAHPLRLQMLSLLTATALSAAEVATELGITHANASYHLRTLLASGHIVVAEEVVIRGGKARRYRYRWDDPGQATADADGAARPAGIGRTGGTAGGKGARVPGGAADADGAAGRGTAADRRLVFGALARELVRRAEHAADGPSTLTDAELWVEPSIAADIRDRLVAVSVELHEAARKPRSPGSQRVNLTIALFPMDPDP